jgi:5-methylcytosine-specific restriction endonuclease McrA
VETKVCVLCNEERPLGSFSSTGRPHKGVIYRRNVCNPCRAVQNLHKKRGLPVPSAGNTRKYYRKYPKKERKGPSPRFDESSGEWVKVCGCCRVVKPVSEFHKNHGKPQSRCKQCRREYMKNYRPSEETKANKRAYDRERRFKTPEERRAFYDKYFHTEKVRAKRREYNRSLPTEIKRAHGRAYYRRHPQRVAERQRMRRALKYQAAVEPFTCADIVERDGPACYLCGKELTPREVTLEHVVPLSRGGAHVPENARIACKPCNSRKGAKLLEELDLAEFPGAAGGCRRPPRHEPSARTALEGYGAAE